MPSQYMIVQYGNVMTGEYHSIGIFAYDMDPNATEVYTYFMPKFDRIYQVLGWDGDRILEGIVDHWLKTVVNQQQLQNIIKAQSPFSSLIVLEARISLDEPWQVIQWAKETFLAE